MKDLAGQTAFVTGAASGIGLGIATALAQAGVKVMLCDIEEAALKKAVADLKQTNADGEGGHIVSTASIAGLISGTSSPYNVTKYGVVALSEGLRRDLAPRGIGVS